MLQMGCCVCERMNTVACETWKVQETEKTNHEELLSGVINSCCSAYLALKLHDFVRSF